MDETELSTTTNEADNGEESTPQQDPNAEEAGQEGLLSEEELAEIEYDGEKYSLPKKLKDAFLRQDDYSRKTQELAEHRRAIEAHAEIIAEREQFAEATAQLRAHAIAVEERLQQFKGVNWQQLQAQNPQQASALWMQYQQLKEARQGVESQMTAAHEMFRERTAEANRAAIERGMAELKKDIPNFSPQLADELVNYGVAELGLEEGKLRTLTDARAVKLLHKAYLYDKFIADNPATASQVSGKQNPVTTLKGGKSIAATKNPDNLPVEEWLKWRNSQLKSKSR